MTIPLLDSVKSIERQYLTGEEPVLVMCSDKSAYVCKYMRSSFAAYKLVCELVGAKMANISRQCSMKIVGAIPHEWNVPADVVEKKISQLFEPEWIEGVWQNFIDCLTENIGK